MQIDRILRTRGNVNMVLVSRFFGHVRLVAFDQSVPKNAHLRSLECLVLEETRSYRSAHDETTIRRIPFALG